MSQPDTHKQNSQITKNTAIGYAAPIVVFLLLLGGVGVLFGCSSQPQATNQPVSNQSTTQTQETAANSSLEPAINWRTDNHVHGLTVNPDNPKVLYVATHNGLVKRSETGEWFWMEPEKERADYMGFTTHPTDSKRFYASGHPHTGGNLGFQVTENLGQDWKQISMPGVDFHAMAVAPSNPNVFYAWPASGAQGFHTSTDGGKTWIKPRMVGLEATPFSLAVDPRNPSRVFATTRAGLYESTNSGNDWTLGRVFKLQPQKNGGDRNHGRIICSKFLISGSDTSKLLESIDSAFNNVALTIDFTAKRTAARFIC